MPDGVIVKAVCLTKREKEILELLAMGMSSKQIGHEFGTSEWTVKNQVVIILEKLEASNRTQAVVIALQNRYISTCPLSQ